MKALITGLTGQDGSYLTELLLSKGYEVHGIVRRTTTSKDVHPKVIVHSATLENYVSLFKTVNEVKPDECYHLGAQTFVTDSFKDEFSTMAINTTGTHYILNAIKEIVPKCKFYFAGTSEMFGNSPALQNENTPMNPVSPYGISKLAGYHLCRYYRQRFGMFICCGILFNHESPRRGKEFVTQKIVMSAKNKEVVRLGNLEAQRDWGYAPEFVNAMWLMLQQNEPDDYVIATGRLHSVKEFAEIAYRKMGLDWQDKVIVSQELYRPNELHILCGDSTKARNKLGWEAKIDIDGLIERMLDD